MISDTIAQSFALIYAVTDLVLCLNFYRHLRHILSINIDLLMLIKFKSLIDFYVKGETSTFLQEISDLNSFRNISQREFAEKYRGISGEIYRVYQDFSLPYEAMTARHSLKNSMLSSFLLSVFQLSSVAISLLYPSLIYLVLVALLINTLFWYPLMQQLNNVSEIIKKARSSVGIEIEKLIGG
jgi:hypothetical protein